ncbi:EF-hand [Backusella circina FSU 941]|nr:EF-hand [Backusella circina FSU 941]
MAYNPNQYGGYGGYGQQPGGYQAGGYQQQQQQQQQAYSPQQQHHGGYGGYNNRPGQPQGCPPGADPQLWSWFTAVDTDHSGQLSVDELQRALVNGDWSPFNIETVRTMVNMFDKDNSGTIDFNEFAGLWKYIEDWKRCFQTFDEDNSGNIDHGEMSRALKTFGYNLSDQFIHVLVQKFDKYGKNRKGNITFDNFVQACVTVKTLTDSFRQFDTDNDGWIQINYEQFLSLVIKQRS